MRPKNIFAALGILLYAIILVLGWFAGGVWHERKARALLQMARQEFSRRLDNNIRSVQWYMAALVFDRLGGRTNATSRTLAETRAIANDLHIFELNVSDAKGITIASNLPRSQGYDYRENEESAQFLRLLNANGDWRFSQPFRPSTIDKNDYCKYYGEAFDDRSGFVQLGFSMTNLMQAIAYSDARLFRDWRFGRTGYFSGVDVNSDNIPDSVGTWRGPPLPPEGLIERVAVDGERAMCLTYAFAGCLFKAILPNREFGDQRIMAFRIFAITSAFLLLVFLIVFAHFARSARRIANLRREADRRIADDLAVARRIQLSSLPNARKFALDELSFALSALTLPAREVGGDSFDFFWTGDRRLALMIADASGKGVPAALFVQEAKHAFIDALREEGALAPAVRSMNETLARHNEVEMFVTAWFGLLDLKTGELEFVNAGHNRPYVLPASGEPRRLDARGGRLLGMFDDIDYRASRLQLQVGDRLVLYTDGVTEAMNAERKAYGDARFASLLATHPKALTNAIVNDVADHVGAAERSDDLSLLILGWNGAVPEISRTFTIDESTLAQTSKFLIGAVRLDDRKQAFRLINAADELIANVVNYSYAKALTVSVASVEGRCRVVLRDDGVDYNPLMHRDPQTHMTLEDRPVGGLGLLMTKRLVSSFTYCRSSTENVTTLVQTQTVHPAKTQNLV